MLFRDLWLPVSLGLILIGLLSGLGPVAALGVLLLAGGGVARLWSRLSLERVRYQRLLPETRGFVGDTIPCQLQITNGKWLPLPWLEIEERFPEATPPQGVRLEPSHIPRVGFLRRTTALAWHERLTWRYNLLCTTRGYYRLGPARLRSGDLFGLFPQERQETTVDHLIVYPQTIPLGELGLPAQRPLGEFKGRERIFEDPLRFLGLRDYQPGDTLRRIDWKATARRGQLQSRVYEPSTTRHLLVALNINTLPYVWEGHDPVLLERAVSVAASVARQAYEARYAVGLLANGSFPDADRPIKVPVGRSPHQLNRVLEALAMISPFTIVPLAGLLHRESHNLPLGTTLTVVAALLSEALAATLVRLRETGHPVSLLWVAEEPLDAYLPGVVVHQLGQALRRREVASS